MAHFFLTLFSFFFFFFWLSRWFGCRRWSQSDTGIFTGIDKTLLVRNTNGQRAWRNVYDPGQRKASRFGQSRFNSRLSIGKSRYNYFSIFLSFFLSYFLISVSVSFFFHCVDLWSTTKKKKFQFFSSSSSCSSFSVLYRLQIWITALPVQCRSKLNTGVELQGRPCFSVTFDSTSTSPPLDSTKTKENVVPKSISSTLWPLFLSQVILLRLHHRWHSGDYWSMWDGERGGGRREGGREGGEIYRPPVHEIRYF